MMLMKKEEWDRLSPEEKIKLWKVLDPEDKLAVSEDGVFKGDMMSCKECKEQRHSIDVYFAVDWKFCPFCGKKLVVR